MGLFSDDLEYRDLDALCIKVRRAIGETSVELPIYVDVRISYITSYNAKEVIIDGSTVKDLKKSGRLLSAFKPIFERYIIKKVNEYPEYAECIFPDDFFGEPKLDFNEQRAKELINPKLFKDALILIDNPEGFDEVKFEKIYGIAPVVFKVRKVTSGVSMPYNYSEMLKCETASKVEETEMDSAQEQNVDTKCGLEIKDATKSQEEVLSPEPQENLSDFEALSSEYEELKRECKIKRGEIETIRRKLDGCIRGKDSLAMTLSEQQALVEEYKLIPKQIEELYKTIKTEESRISQLEAEKNDAVKNLDSLQENTSTLDFLMDIINHGLKEDN